MITNEELLRILSENDGSVTDTSSEADLHGTEDQTGDKNIPCENPRKRQKKENKRHQAKILRNSGESCTNVKGNIVEAKTFQNKDCGCSKKCCNLFSENDRYEQFKKFHKIGDFSKRNAYLCGLIHQAPIKQRRPRDGSKGNKQCTNIFFLHKENNTLRVCKKFFLETLVISDGRISRALAKVQNGRLPGEDLRGKHAAASKISAEQKQAVRDHINSFPAFQSHYSRKDNPNRKYLSPDLCIRKMYTLYVEWCIENNISPVKEYFYRHIFNTEFNLHFHVLRKDTCKTCDRYKQLLDTEENAENLSQLKTQHEVHLVKAEKARNCLKVDSERAKDHIDVGTLTVDLQKALPFPKLSVSEAYYRRNMYCYNFGIHDMNNNVGYMYVWDETMTSRGSREIASCLRKHIFQHPKKNIIIYSDTCTGQNRNINVSLTLLKLKFLVSGHSYLPNDSDFGVIEKASRKKTIYVADDWYNEINNSKRNQKFVTIKMQEDDFFETHSLEKTIHKRKKDVLDNKINWLNIQWLRYQKNKPFSIQYKYCLNDDVPFNELDLKPSKEGRPKNLGNIVQEKLYDGPRPVSHLKKRDMLYLLKYIPPIHHQFFKRLKSSKETEDEGPLVEGDSDSDYNIQNVF